MAPPMTGVLNFIKRCNDSDVDIYIVSHKTEYAEIKTSGNNLRTKALEWLRYNIIKHGLKLNFDNVYFSNTRGEKINIIKDINCTYFIDDLEDVLCDPLFPNDTQKILLSDCTNNYCTNKTIIVKENWKEIEKHVYR